MRYIGGKAKLVPEILATLAARGITGGTFADVFYGGGSVSLALKAHYRIVAADILTFSYASQRARIVLNSVPTFAKIKDPFELLNNLKPCQGFVTKHYCPAGGRMYFTDANGGKIDAIRQQIQDWRSSGLITEDGYYYLLYALLEAVSLIANTTGVFGAYLKTWDARALKPLLLNRYPVLDNGKTNCALKEEAATVAGNLEVDVMYLDPPYNGRQYLSNYHVLEVIARWDTPEIRGVTGQPNYTAGVSDFAKKGKAKAALASLLSVVRAKLLLLSYNTEGILSEEEITTELAGWGDPRKLQVQRIPHRRYQAKKANLAGVDELLFSITP